MSMCSQPMYTSKPPKGSIDYYGSFSSYYYIIQDSIHNKTTIGGYTEDFSIYDKDPSDSFVSIVHELMCILCPDISRDLIYDYAYWSMSSYYDFNIQHLPNPSSLLYDILYNPSKVSFNAFRYACDDEDDILDKILEKYKSYSLADLKTEGFLTDVILNRHDMNTIITDIEELDDDYYVDGAYHMDYFKCIIFDGV